MFSDEQFKNDRLEFIIRDHISQETFQVLKIQNHLQSSLPFGFLFNSQESQVFFQNLFDNESHSSFGNENFKNREFWAVQIFQGLFVNIENSFVHL